MGLTKGICGRFPTFPLLLAVCVSLCGQDSLSQALIREQVPNAAATSDGK
jgi:hypothetical protein